MNEPLVYVFQENDWKEKKVFSQIFPDLSINNKSCKNSYICYKGMNVYTTFMIDIINECKITINYIKAKQDIPQGIDVSVHNTNLKIIDGSNDKTKSGFVFMYQTWVGSIIPLLCTPIKFRSIEKQQQKKWLMIYNIWETERRHTTPTGGLGDTTYIERDAWQGNYGVVIEQKEKDAYRLHFSCGKARYPNITFEDLVLDVAIEGEYHARFQCSKFS